MPFVEYENGTRAGFTTIEEARAQAAHDNSTPGQPSAVRIFEIEGVEGEDSYSERTVEDEKKVAKLACDCPLCAWHAMSQAQREKSPHLHPSVPRAA